MPAISITAPQFTDEDLRLEQQSYTEAEIQEAHRDLYGGSPVPESPCVTDQQVLLENVRKIIDAFPPEEKEAYLQAVERAPYLIDVESDPRLFLKAANVWTAAEQFVNYWELRLWLFGERAWLPMTATGNGALLPQDVELLGTGFCTLLPQEDRHGRGIVCFQVPAEPLNADRLAMARVTFYILSLALRCRPLVVQNGLVVVVNTRHYTMERYDRKFIKCIAYLLTGWHPVTTRAIHILAPPGSRSCLKLILPYVRYFMTRHIRQRFRIHQGTVAQCALDLEDYGIQTYSLPVEMGGEFHKDQFREWLQDIIQPNEFHQEKDYVASLEMDGYINIGDGSVGTTSS